MNTVVNYKQHEKKNSNIDTFDVLESLEEAIERSQLPKLELSVFNGDVLEFQQWLASFERMTEKNTSDRVCRLHYLIAAVHVW